MADLEWTRHVTGKESPYPEDRRYRWTCGVPDLEITKEGDGKYWLRYRNKPLGMGPRLADAKEAARRYVAENPALSTPAPAGATTEAVGR